MHVQKAGSPGFFLADGLSGLARRNSMLLLVQGPDTRCMATPSIPNLLKLDATPSPRSSQLPSFPGPALNSSTSLNPLRPGDISLPLPFLDGAGTCCNRWILRWYAASGHGSIPDESFPHPRAQAPSSFSSLCLSNLLDSHCTLVADNPNRCEREHGYS